MRLFALLLTLLVSASSWAQTMGTKADPMVMVPSTGGGSGVMPIVQLGIAIAIIVTALKFGLPKLVPMMSKKLHPNLGSQIKIEDSAVFAGGSLYIVEAKGKSLLLCAGTTGVSCLADLTATTAVAAEPPAFFEVLDEAKKDPTVATRAVIQIEEPAPTVSKPAASKPSADDVKLALERLSRLTG